MKRSDVLLGSAALGLFYAAFPNSAAASPTATQSNATATAGGVPVAFLVSDGAVMIDFAGPWEVFQDARVPSRAASAFTPYTVAESTSAISMSGGARLVPSYTFANAPAPKIVVVPGQGDPTPAMIDWMRAVSRKTDVMMSVCTGALLLAAAGLLDGHSATTHHSAFSTLAMQYPKVTVKRGVRFVDNGHVVTSAGLSAGIDLALHVVSRYYGIDSARGTAYDMEYLSQAWIDPASNRQYGKPPVAKAGEAVCPVCWMSVDPKTAPSSLYKDNRYYFCLAGCKERFDASPAVYLQVA